MVFKQSSMRLQRLTPCTRLAPTLHMDDFAIDDMTLNPWSKVQVLAGFSCVALHRCQKLFESPLGRYWFLGDHVLIQVNHSYSSVLLRDTSARDEATLLYTECLKLPLGCM